MQHTIDQVLRKGIKAHRLGKIQEANKLYNLILQAQPGHSDANHNMGVLAVGLGKVNEALLFFKTALQSNSNVAQYWLSYISALLKIDRVQEAQQAFIQAKTFGFSDEKFIELETTFSGKIRNMTTFSKLQPDNNGVQDSYQNYSDNNQDSQIKGMNVNNAQGEFSLVLPSRKENHLEQDLPEKYLQQILELYAEKKFHSLLEEIDELLKKFPFSIDLHNVSGLAFTHLEKFDFAIESYQKALKISPRNAGILLNIGNVFQTMNNFPKAINSYKKAIKIAPNDSKVHNNLGNAFSKNGNYNSALNSFEQSVLIDHLNYEAYYNMGETLRRKGKFSKAIISFKQSIKINPNFAEAYNNLGTVFDAIGNRDFAIKNFRKALHLKPDFAEAHNNFGITLADIGNKEEAIESYNKALKLKPNYAEAHRNISTVKNYEFPDEQFLQMERMLDTHNLKDYDRVQLCFALGKAFEDLQDYSNSFRVLREGNRIQKKLLGYNIAQDSLKFQALRNSFEIIQKVSKKIQNTAFEECTPIFILGMPRSGTTLVEQIISSHSEVTGAGELSYVHDFGELIATGKREVSTHNLETFKEKYLAKLKKKSAGKPFCTDKTPLNFYYIGLLCSIFPNSKIIHVKRKPAATCWSNYKHFFPSKGFGYCYSLDDVVSYYKLYSSLMGFWEKYHSGQMYTICYDNLTIGQEKETESLIRFLNLSWQDPCLFPERNLRTVRTSSTLQVRNKIYRGSSDNWQKFNHFIGGAFDTL